MDGNLLPVKIQIQGFHIDQDDDSKITLNVDCHCKESFGYAQDKLHEEEISMEFYGPGDCFALLAMTSYIASIFRNHSGGYIRFQVSSPKNRIFSHTIKERAELLSVRPPVILPLYSHELGPTSPISLISRDYYA